jgi:hypothetical protein
MHSRAARLTLVAVLLAIAVGAGVQLSFVSSRRVQLDNDERFVLARIARLELLAAEIGAAQAAYVAPGQPDAPWLAQVSSLTAKLADDVAAIQPRARSVEAAARIEGIREAAMLLGEADTGARENLLLEHDLIASDLVFGESRAALMSIRKALGELKVGEETAFAAARTSVDQQLVLLPALATAIWLVGLLMLARRPAAPLSPALMSITTPPDAAPVGEPAAAAPSIDLAAAADLCTALSRVTSSSALPDMLARAAVLLDAPGVIVWMGAGEELFAATSHGYDPRVIGRLGPIARDAENATAAAWRTGEVRTVTGDMTSNGAIVAPMFGPDSCIGVFAAEVRHGREEDAATRAVTLMLAAQLATVVPAWPAASTPPRAAQA